MLVIEVGFVVNSCLISDGARNIVRSSFNQFFFIIVRVMDIIIFIFFEITIYKNILNMIIFVEHSCMRARKKREQKKEMIVRKERERERGILKVSINGPLHVGNGGPSFNTLLFNYFLLGFSQTTFPYNNTSTIQIYCT